MIDYEEFDKYYIGTSTQIIGSAGGILLEMAPEDTESVFYRTSDKYFIDVINGGIAMLNVNGDTVPMEVRWLLHDDSLVQISTRKQLRKKVPFMKRLTFEPYNSSLSFNK